MKKVLVFLICFSAFACSHNPTETQTPSSTSDSSANSNTYESIAAYSENSSEPQAERTVEQKKEIVNNFFYNDYYFKCLQRNKDRNYVYLEEKCKCNANKFVENKFGTDRSCHEFNLREGDQIVEPVSSCESLTAFTQFEKGMYLEQVKAFTKSGWQNGIKKRDLGIIWEIASFDDNGVVMKLVKGNYKSLEIGESATRKNSAIYNKAYPNATPNEQIIQSYNLCLNPTL